MKSSIQKENLAMMRMEKLTKGSYGRVKWMRTIFSLVISSSFYLSKNKHPMLLFCIIQTVWGGG